MGVIAGPLSMWDAGPYCNRFVRPRNWVVGVVHADSVELLKCPLARAQNAGTVQRRLVEGIHDLLRGGRRSGIALVALRSSRASGTRGASWADSAVRTRFRRV